MYEENNKYEILLYDDLDCNNINNLHVIKDELKNYRFNYYINDFVIYIEYMNKINNYIVYIDNHNSDILYRNNPNTLLDFEKLMINCDRLRSEHNFFFHFR